MAGRRKDTGRIAAPVSLARKLELGTEVGPTNLILADYGAQFASFMLATAAALIVFRQRFFETLMEKYGTPDRDRPRGFFPRIGEVTVYAISIERITGKECLLPGLAERWPALDRTKSPDAQLPETCVQAK